MRRTKSRAAGVARALPSSQRFSPRHSVVRTLAHRGSFAAAADSAPAIARLPIACALVGVALAAAVGATATLPWNQRALFVDIARYALILAASAQIAAVLSPRRNHQHGPTPDTPAGREFLLHWLLDLATAFVLGWCVLARLPGSSSVGFALVLELAAVALWTTGASLALRARRGSAETGIGPAADDRLTERARCTR